MKKVEAMIKPFTLDAVQEALVGSGIQGMTISEVKRVEPRAHPAWYRGAEYIVWFAPQIKVEVMVADEQVELCVGAIQRCGKTDDDDSGEIVVLSVEDMIRIRTGEHLRRAA